jgi:hypothetical protein
MAEQRMGYLIVNGRDQSNIRAPQRGWRPISARQDVLRSVANLPLTRLETLRKLLMVFSAQSRY